MPKISELNAITSVANTDLLMVVHDPAGLPSTNKVTLTNFAGSITSLIGYANTTSSGAIKVGTNLEANSTGFLNVTGTAALPSNGQSEGFVATWDATTNAVIWQAFSGVRDLNFVDSANTYVVQEHDNAIFADPNAISQDITIVLPDASSASPATIGKTYAIKNLNPGAGPYKVRITTQSGLDTNSNILESPITGSFVVYHDIEEKGNQQDWIYDGSVWRHFGAQTGIPVFIGNEDTFTQLALQNRSSGNNASADIIAYNNESNVAEGSGPFVDMGINSNNYNDTTFGNVWGPSDAYLYNYGGNLVIGPASNHKIKFVAGNTNVEDVMMTVSAQAITVNTNIFATHNYFDIYGRNLAEISASTNGIGGGNNQSYVWAYQQGDNAEVGQYVQNAVSYSNMYHYSNGMFNYYGQDSVASKTWNYHIRPYDSNAIGIKPSGNFDNELVILPTADYDIHLYEGTTDGAITLGNYSQTNFRVYGPGGANNGGGQYGNDIRAELHGNSSFLISSNGFNWTFESDGSLTIANYVSLPTKSMTGWYWNYGLTGPTLQLSNNPSNEVIITGPTPTSSYASSQRIIIQGQRGYGNWGQNTAGEGGDIYIWAGVGGESDTNVGGSGGDIKIRGGQGQDNEGGYVKIEAGDAAFWNGTAVGSGGYIEITAGDVIEGGGDANNHGGNITISAGRAKTDISKSGTITISTGGSVSGYGRFNTVFNNDGTVTLSSNGDIKNSDGISVIKALPQNIQSSFANYTLTLSDAGKHIYKDDGDGYGVEVPTNASVPFEIGTTITIVSGNGWTYIYPVDGMTTEVWGAGYNQTSTSFYIPNNSMATLLKIGTDKWMLSGAGLAID